jgi:hypothetical protein
MNDPESTVIISGEDALQTYNNPEIAKRISEYMNKIQGLGELHVRILFQKGYGYCKEVYLDTKIIYNPFDYITQFKNFKAKSCILWQRISPLNSLAENLDFLRYNYIKICYDIAKALYALKKIGILHNDTCLDNIGIYKGNFVLFDFDGAGTPAQKGKDYSNDYRNLVISFKFHGVELPPEMLTFIGLHSLIEIVYKLKNDNSLQDTVNYLESLSIIGTA